MQAGYKTPQMPDLSPKMYRSNVYKDTGFDIFSFLRLLWRALAQGYLKLCNLHLKTPLPPRKSTKQKNYPNACLRLLIVMQYASFQLASKTGRHNSTGSSRLRFFA